MKSFLLWDSWMNQAEKWNEPILKKPLNRNSGKIAATSFIPVAVSPSFFHFSLLTSSSVLYPQVDHNLEALLVMPSPFSTASQIKTKINDTLLVLLSLFHFGKNNNILQEILPRNKTLNPITSKVKVSTKFSWMGQY